MSGTGKPGRRRAALGARSSSTGDAEETTIQFVLLKQFFCNHRYRKEPSYRQLRKDDNKVMWICYKCNKHLERDRWNPPEGAVKSQD